MKTPLNYCVVSICILLLTFPILGDSSVQESPDEKARRGAALYERPATRAEGLLLLREAEQAGSPFAKARIAAFYYLGEGGYDKDCEKAFKLMKAAIAKGFPSDGLPLKEVEEACAQLREHRKASKGRRTAARKAGDARPGYGCPGVLKRYEAASDLQKYLNRYNLKAGWFCREPGAVDSLRSWERRKLDSNALPYLLYVPRQASAAVPMIVYFGGTGEQGTNLVAQFHQSTVFKMVTSAEFQKRHPCYLFAPMVPAGSDIRCGKARSTPMADLVCDAMYAVIRNAKTPRVDTNRIYLTGLSYGGSAAYTFPFGYPGRFAASLPVAGFATQHEVPDEKPGSIWLVHNENEYESAKMQAVLSNMVATVVARGGEFRFSSFPDKGHNAWDRAWQEDALWDWMFSKTADGSPVGGSLRKVAGGHGEKTGQVPMNLANARCSASRPGREAGFEPERAADGLDSTCYVSDAPVGTDDWWRIDFPAPITGKITILTGTADGRDILSRGVVEVSENGNDWQKAGGFSKRTGVCRFQQESPISHLRVRSTMAKSQVLAVRSITILAE